MALRHNHYDLAFEEFLRGTRIPYVAVDESRRALLQQASLKSMDFIVYSGRGRNLLVDVKGRRFPSGGDGGRHKWENWATADDIRSLLAWQQVFGGGFRSVLVFAYQLLDDRLADDFDKLFAFRDQRYAFFGVWADEYQTEMHTRSRSWDTVTVARQTFHALRAPIEDFL